MLNTTMVFNQTPTNAGTDAMNQPLAGQQSAGVKQQPLGFKKKLENCITIDEPPYGVPMMVNQTGNIQDNSMATASSAQQVPNEIVGILEGFGLLDYRSDLPQVPSESKADTSANAADMLLQGMMQSSEQTGTLEKYARMLSKDQLSQLPEDMQQAILKAVGDYLGSFESTNKKIAQTIATQDATQTAALEATQTTSASAAADTAALPDRIASLLLKLAAKQDAKPADSALKADSVMPSEVSAVSADAKSQTVTEPAESTAVFSKQEMAAQTSNTKVQADDAAMQTSNTKVQADDAAMQTDDAKVQTDKPKIPAADQSPQQASKTDMPVQPSAQSQVTQNTDTVQTKADVPQTAQTDFVKDNVMRIVDKLSTEVSDGKYDFDVELKPDFLGKVNIKLTMENGEIRMQIKTDDIGVKGMFADQASSMQAVLKDKGIAVTNIDITYQSQMQTGDDRQAYRQNSSGGKRQSSRTRVSMENIAGTDVFETMTEITGYTHTGSSVEYLA